MKKSFLIVVFTVLYAVNGISQNNLSLPWPNRGEAWVTVSKSSTFYFSLGFNTSLSNADAHFLACNEADFTPSDWTQYFDANGNILNSPSVTVHSFGNSVGGYTNMSSLPNGNYILEVDTNQMSWLIYIELTN